MTQLEGPRLILGFPGIGDDEVFDLVLEDLRAERAAGIILFRANCRTVAQTTKLIRRVRAVAPAAEVAVDQEGGAVQRLQNLGIDWPSAAAVARLSDQQIGKLYAPLVRELQDLGFTRNLAPVVDLSYGPDRDCPVIGGCLRSYGDVPRIVDVAGALIAAHLQAGMGVSLKHFPGHGLARADSHLGVVDHGPTFRWQEIDPYRQLIGAFGDDSRVAVMLGHLDIEQLDGEHPSSLSRRIVNGLLRGDLGFRGPVWTDDLSMRAIADRYSLGDVRRLAKAAGIDRLIFSQHPMASGGALYDSKLARRFWN